MLILGVKYEIIVLIMKGVKFILEFELIGF